MKYFVCVRELQLRVLWRVNVSGYVWKPPSSSSSSSSSSIDGLGHLHYSHSETMWNYESYRQLVGFTGPGGGGVSYLQRTQVQEETQTYIYASRGVRTHYRRFRWTRHFVPYTKQSMWWDFWALKFEFSVHHIHIQVNKIYLLSYMLHWTLYKDGNILARYRLRLF
jgi:hypothetical protein